MNGPAKIDEAFGFDEDGERVPIVWPAIYDDPEADEPPAEADSVAESQSFDTIAFYSAFFFDILLTEGAKPEAVGRKVFLLQFLFKMSPHESQRELAELLGVTPARISQKLSELTEQINALRKRLPLLALENSRQPKTEI